MEGSVDGMRRALESYLGWIPTRDGQIDREIDRLASRISSLEQQSGRYPAHPPEFVTGGAEHTLLALRGMATPLAYEPDPSKRPSMGEMFFPRPRPE